MSEQRSEQTVGRKMLREISAAAAAIAVEKYQEQAKEHQSKIKDNRLHNTKLLLQKYRWLKEYNDKAVYETAQICSEGMDEVLQMMGVDLGDRYQVGSIRNSVIVTRVIMEHIETMLEVYKTKCMKSSKPEVKRRWEVLYHLYISPEPMTAADICELMHISSSLVYVDIDNACKDLTPLFFGLDLTEFWS